MGDYCSRRRAGRGGGAIVPLQLQHFPIRLSDEETPSKKKRGRCVKCRQQNRRIDSSWFCRECTVWLCHSGDPTKDCFLPVAQAVIFIINCISIYLNRIWYVYCSSQKKLHSESQRCASRIVCEMCMYTVYMYMYTHTCTYTMYIVHMYCIHVHVHCGIYSILYCIHVHVHCIPYTRTCTYTMYIVHMYIHHVHSVHVHTPCTKCTCTYTMYTVYTYIHHVHVHCIHVHVHVSSILYCIIRTCPYTMYMYCIYVHVYTYMYTRTCTQKV